MSSRAAAVGRLTAQLAAVDARLSTAQTGAEIAVERWHAAVVAQQKATAAAKAAEARAARASSRVGQARRRLGSYAASSYRSGGVVVPLTAVLTARSPSDMLHEAGMLQVIGSHHNEALDGLNRARTARANAVSTAERAANQRDAARRSADTSKASAIAKAAAVRAQSKQVSQQRQTLQAQLLKAQQAAGLLHQARAAAIARAKADAIARAASLAAARSAAARAAATEAATPRQPLRSRSTASAPARQISGDAAAVAIGAALSQLGTPYAWGGGTTAGPSPDIDGTGVVGYDCSGILLYAWAKAGIYLPHSSQADYSQGLRVPLAQRSPGDLILYSSDGTQAGIHHVSMYIGGGQMLEAPTFGIPVRVYSVYPTGIMPSVVRLG